jgi:hypothetical protein
MENHRHILISNGRVDQKHVEGMGKAVFLHDFLVHHQTDPNGLVFYGKPISYGWIQRRFPGSKQRTLRRWLAHLREGGYIAVSRRDHGFSVRILNQKKFAPKQLPLFPPAEPLCITSGKVAETNAQKTEPTATSGRSPTATSGRSQERVSILS